MTSLEAILLLYFFSMACGLFQLKRPSTIWLMAVMSWAVAILLAVQP